MAERVRNSEWKQDQLLHNDIKKYVLGNLKRSEILDFVTRDYPQYAWSLSSRKRRLAYFDIKYVRYNIEVEDVENAVREEMEGPDQLLGYRAMQRKIWEQHQLPVPRNLVYDVMTMVDPEGLERRGHVGKKKIRRGGTGRFTSLVMHLSMLSPRGGGGGSGIGGEFYFLSKFSIKCPTIRQ